MSLSKANASTLNDNDDLSTSTKTYEYKFHIKTVDMQSDKAAETLAQSLKETGFAILINHSVPYNLVQEVYEDWHKYFSSDKKFKDLYDKDIQAGYFPFREEQAKGYPIKNLMEYYHYYLWHHLPDEMSNNTTLLFHKMLELSKIVANFLEQELPIDIQDKLQMPMTKMIDNSDLTVMRILHYPALTGEEERGALRSAPHEDINLFTLLTAASTPGLQVKDLKGKWHNVECDPSSIVMNAGDMLQMATNKYYVSTTHQVVNPSESFKNTARYSVPFFVAPRKEVRLSPTHTAYEYFLERIKENGLKEEKKIRYLFLCRTF